jgi:O-antigen/teichoic acid export membrane protein
MRNLARSGFFKLFAGTAFSQMVSILAVPIMARLYSADGVGIFSLALGTIAIIQVLATGRYEQAIFLEKNKNKVIVIVKLCRIIALAVSSLAFLLGFMAWILNPNSDLFNNYTPVFALAPILLYLMTSNQILLVLCNRYEMYGDMSKSRLLVASTSTLLLVLFGLLDNNPVWLIIASIFAYGSSNFIFWKKYNKDISYSLTNFSLGRLMVMAKRHNKFPLYALPADLINVFSYNAPLYFLGVFFGTTVVGNYSMVHRVLNAPVSLITSSFSEVFKANFIRSIDSNHHISVFKKTLYQLSVIGGIFLITIFIFGEILISKLLGDGWNLAEKYANIMILMYALKLIVSPLSSVIFLKGKIKYDLQLHVIMLVMTMTALSIGSYFKSDIISISLYTVANVLMYGIYLVISKKLAYEK